MKKGLCIFAGVVGSAALLINFGSWFTGTQIEGAVKSVAQTANLHFKNLEASSSQRGKLEVLSIDTGFYNSTVRYRIVLENQASGADAKPFETVIVEHIEHGPFPWSRIKNSDLMPVMAVSNYSMQKTPSTEQWFAEAKGASPLKGSILHGYRYPLQGDITLQPVQMSDKDYAFSFAGLSVNFSHSDNEGDLNINGEIGTSKLVLTPPAKPHFQIGFKGGTVKAKLKRTPHDFYVGKKTTVLNGVEIIGGEQHSALDFKKLRIHSLSSAKDELMKGRDVIEVSDIKVNANLLGSVKMDMSYGDIHLPSMTKVQDIIENQLQNLPADQQELKWTPEELQALRPVLIRFLGANPKIAIESFSLKTPNGQGNIRLSLGLNDTLKNGYSSAPELIQMFSFVDTQLKISKPMIVDLYTIVAHLNGQTDSRAIAEEGQRYSESFGQIVEQLKLGKVDGANIETTLNYRDGQIDAGGEKMGVEQFMRGLMLRVALCSACKTF